MPSLQLVSCSSTLLHVSKLHLHLAFASQQQKNCGFLASRCPSGLLSRCSIGDCCVAVLCNTQIDIYKTTTRIWTVTDGYAFEFSRCIKAELLNSLHEPILAERTQHACGGSVECSLLS